MLGILFCAAACVAGPAASDLPVVVVRVDDCNACWLNPLAALDNKSPFQYAKEHRIPITWGIIVDAANGSGIPWDKLKEYLDYAGGEPASHSYHHTSIGSPELAAFELTASKQAIEQHLPGYGCTSFIQPGTWSGDAHLSSFAALDGPVGLVLRSTYDQSMAYVVNGVAAGPVYYKHGLLYSASYDSRWTNWTADMTNATLEAIAASPGSMFIFEVHNVGANPSILITVDATAFKALVDKLDALRTAGRIEVMSLRDACARSVSPDVNRIGDPGFETVTLGSLNPAGPWLRTGGTYVASSGGVGASRYARLANATCELRTWKMVLSPGRYELAWYQKPEPGTANASGLTVNLTMTGAQRGVHELDNASYVNADPGVWERKRALVVCEDRMPTTVLSFRPSAGEGYGVDNVSLTPAPSNPAASPSATTVVPSCGQCTVSWNTPDSGSIFSICVRWSASTYPLSPDEGQAFATVAAVPGARQQITAPIEWRSMAYAHFSVFSIMADGSYSPPDIARVSIDGSPPSTPKVTAVCTSAGRVSVSWSSADAESGIACSNYAVGTTPGGDNIVAWTKTSSDSAELTGLPVSTPVFVTVRTENPLGIASDAGGATVSAGGIVAACSKADGTPAEIGGAVSAVFGDCCYIQESDRSRGIRVIGVPDCHEGDVITVTGYLTTSAGERAVVADVPEP